MASIYQVDSFTSERFKGNPAAICILDKFPDDNTMLNIAKEMNLSETAFVVKNKDEFMLRWFTTTFEIDLCGHATLAAAHVLWTEGFWSVEKPIIFNTLSGKLIVRLVNNYIEMDFPTIEYYEIDKLPDLLLEGLGGIKPIFIAKAGKNYLIEAATEGIVKDINIDVAKLVKSKIHGVMVTARGSEKYDFVSRFFTSEIAVPEDPVTGSAHCTLALFWSDKLGINKFKAYQYSSRGGELNIELKESRVLLRGKAVTVLRGELIME